MPLTPSQDSKLIASIARGDGAAAAAKSADCARSTVYERLADDQFVAAVRAARRQMIDEAYGKLTAAASQAAALLISLMELPEENGRAADRRVMMQSASRVLTMRVDLADHLEFEERLSRLERLAEAGTLTGPKL